MSIDCKAPKSCFKQVHEQIKTMYDNCSVNKGGIEVRRTSVVEHDLNTGMFFFTFSLNAE